MSGRIEEHGIPVYIDLQNVPDATVYLDRPMDDIESLYMQGYYMEGSNTTVVKVTFDSTDIDIHRSFRGTVVYNAATGAAINNPDTGTPYINLINQADGSTYLSTPCFRNSPIVLSPGTAAVVREDFQSPLPISHNMKLNLKTLHIKVTTINDAATVTFTRLLLFLRCFSKFAKYRDPAAASVAGNNTFKYAMGVKFGASDK